MDKIVLFTQRVEYIEAYGERRDCADQRIAEFIYECGYIPVPVPNSLKCIKDILQNCSLAGVVLTGGNSLVKYGGTAPERDESDRFLIEYCVENKIPLYGFCRGMQSILDYFGNELVNVEGHVAIRHEIKGQAENIVVNSYHNQGCMKLSNDDLQIEYVGSDGVIEAVRHKNLPILGTMWHPEREKPFDKKDINRITDLFGGER